MRAYYTYLIIHKDLRVPLFLFCNVMIAMLLCAPHTLFADTSTLEHIAEAESETSYVGVRLKTFVWSRGPKTFEELVIHKAPDISYGKELSVVGERKSFNGSHRDERRNENRRNNDQRRDREENRRDGRARESEHNKWREVRGIFSKKDIDLIAENYNLEKSSSTEKIANYETDILTITPKFAGRATHRIFFARENGIILRAEALDAEGVLRAMLVYTRISFDPETVERKWQSFKKEIKPEPARSYLISLAEGKKLLNKEPIQPEYLPPGFQLQSVHGIKGKENTIHLIYTDGLLDFSIFETTDKQDRRSRRDKDSKIIDGTSVHTHRRGPTHAFSWTSADIHCFLFGAMPSTEMEKVVESIIHKAKGK